MQSQDGLPTLELALPHTAKERRGKERPFDERTEPSPPLVLFPSLVFLPCPVELIWQRGGSISQFTQAAAAAFFFFFCAPCLSPPPSTSLFFVCTLVCPCLCALCLCYSACIGWWNIKYSNVEDGPTPEAGNTCLIQAVRRRCHDTGITTYLRPASCAPTYCTGCFLCLLC